jgi:hypothetical protein
MLLARTGQSETLAINIFDKYGNYIHPSQVDVRMQADVSGILEPLGSVRQISDDIYGVLLKSR